MPDLLVLLVAEPTLAIAYVVFGMVGFGTTLVAAPILAHVMPVSTAIPALALTDFIAACTNGLRLGAQVARQELKRLLPGMFIGNAIGAWLLFTVPVNTLMLLLGVFVVLYALNGLRPQGPKPPLSPRWALGLGTVGGVFGALFGAGGWVYSMYLARRLEEPKQIRATMTAVLMFSSLIRVGIFTVAGRYFDTAILLLVLALLPAVALGLYVGHRITLKLDRKRFMQVLYSVLLFTGGSLVVRALA